VPPGAAKGPEAVTEQKDGIHNGRHAPEQSFHLHTGCGSHRNCNAIRAGMFAVRRAQFATVVAGRKALVRLLYQARGQVGKANRISSMKGHE